MPTDLDVLWSKLCAVEEKVDRLTSMLKVRRKKKKARRVMGFGVDVIAGSGIAQDPPLDEGE